MKIEIIESVPIINCHACDAAPAITRIILNKKVAVLLCKSCLYELERQFFRQAPIVSCTPEEKHRIEMHLTPRERAEILIAAVDDVILRIAQSTENRCIK